jgi:phosphopantothenoylcysteine decarboxylase/phosphopantothenate--cysteine ligase
MQIVLGITGGIAAYKACDLITMFKRVGCSVDVIMTEAATKFITPLTIQTLTKTKVNIDMFEQVDILKPEHISLAERADVFLIYPASANIIGKIANGIADDLLSTVAMASIGRKYSSSPVRHLGFFIAPAMNQNMWNNPAVQRNIKTVQEMGFEILGPIEGMLACGDKAIGVAMKPKEVFDEIYTRKGEV